MSNGSRDTGIGFFGLLTILLIGLKLIGCINWSWIWVLSPIWIPFILGLLALLIIVIIVIVLIIIGAIVWALSIIFE